MFDDEFAVTAVALWDVGAWVSCDTEVGEAVVTWATLETVVVFDRLYCQLTKPTVARIRTTPLKTMMFFLDKFMSILHPIPETR